MACGIWDVDDNAGDDQTVPSLHIRALLTSGGGSSSQTGHQRWMKEEDAKKDEQNPR